MKKSTVIIRVCPENLLPLEGKEMSVGIDPRLNVINNRVNTVVGLKRYRQVKKVMEEFNSKLNRETENLSKVDRKIK
jgi:hypothetical protein